MSIRINSYYEASFYRMGLLQDAIEARLVKSQGESFYPIPFSDSVPIVDTREKKISKEASSEEKAKDLPAWSNEFDLRTRVSSDNLSRMRSTSLVEPMREISNGALLDPFGFTSKEQQKRQHQAFTTMREKIHY